MSDFPPPPLSGSLSIEELGHALDHAHAEVTRYFGELEPDDLYRKEGAGWAPVDDLRHLRRVGSRILVGLTTPRIALWWRFGRARNGSRTYEDLYGEYHTILAAGFQAPAPTIPPGLGHIDREGYRRDLLVRWAGLRGELRMTLDRWGESALDSYRLPHPALGKLTARELLYFMHFHDLHHIEVAKRRIAGFATAPWNPPESGGVE